MTDMEKFELLQKQWKGMFKLVGTMVWRYIDCQHRWEEDWCQLSKLRVDDNGRVWR